MTLFARLVRVAFAAAGIGLVVAVGQARPVEAHALLLYSDPPAGARLAEAPHRIVLTFGEAPEPALSFITVTELAEQSGASREVVVSGRGAPIVGAPLQLALVVPPLPRGAYRVDWRVVSEADGGATSGSYSFSVGESPRALAASGSAQSSAPFSLPEVAFRWLFYAGLFIVVGTAFVATVIYGGPEGWAPRLLGLGLGLTTTGLVGTVAFQAIGVRVGIAELLPTVIGRTTVLRAVPLLVACAIAVTRWRRRQWTLDAVGSVGIAGAAVLLADAASSHAAAIGSAQSGGHAHLDVLIQWAHVTSAGVWIGGLLAIVVSLRGRRGSEVGMPLRRFATVAMLSLALVAVTGILRAITELQTVSDLVSTDFGRLLVAKSALLAVLAALGALNHFRNVPNAAKGLRPLRRVGSVELVVAAAVLVLSASLVNVPPPQHAAAPAVAANPRR